MSRLQMASRPLYLMAFVAALTVAGAAHAAGARDAGALKFATVDSHRILSEYKYTTTANADLQVRQRDLDATLGAMQNNPLLTQAEQKEMSDIAIATAAGTALTDAQKARQTQLAAKTESLKNEFQQLSAKKASERTQQDASRLDELIRLAGDTDSRLKDTKQHGDDDIQKQLTTVTAKVKADVKDAISKVAKARSIDVVLTSDVALYAEEEVTDDVLAILNGTAPPPARPAVAAAPMKIASVDLQRILTEYTYTTTADSDIRKKQDEASLRLRTWGQNPLLDEKDQRELGDLAVAEVSINGLTPEQKKRKQQLMDQSKALNDSFDAVKNKAAGDLTADESSRLTTLLNLNKATNTRIQDESNKAQADIQKQVADASAKVQKDVKDAVAKVAKEKGYNLVLSSDVGPVAQADLTDQVINTLNKH